MRILIVSQAPWRNTGYGAPVMGLIGQLQKNKHVCSILAIEERGAGKMTYNGITVYLPPAHDKYGRNFIVSCAEDFGAQAIVTLLDPWIYTGANSFGRFPWIAWCPIDQDPPQRGLEVLEGARYILPMSQFGARVIGENLPNKKITAMPYGIDLKVFSPLEDEDRSASRESFGVNPSHFVVGMVGTNLTHDRKALRENILGFAEFAREHENARLILWSTEDGDFNLPALIIACGMQKQISIVSPWAVHMENDARKMRKFYGALDVLLQASAAEGFGIPIAEAQACGVPVIVADNSSMPELVSERTGWIAKNCDPVWSWLDGWWGRPKPAEIARELRSAYDWLQSDVDKKVMTRDCTGAARQWSWDIVGSAWEDVLLDVQAQINTEAK